MSQRLTSALRVWKERREKEQRGRGKIALIPGSPSGVHNFPLLFLTHNVEAGSGDVVTVSQPLDSRLCQPTVTTPLLYL